MAFLWTTGCLSLFWGRSAYLFQHFKTMWKEGFFNCLNSPFLNFLGGDTKIWPKTTQSCLFVSYCPPPAPLGLHSVGKHLPTKIFSCMNASHVLGGFSAGENAFSHTYYYNEIKIDLVMINYPFLSKWRNLKPTLLEASVLLKSRNDILYPN